MNIERTPTPKEHRKNTVVTPQQHGQIRRIHLTTLIRPLSLTPVAGEVPLPRDATPAATSPPPRCRRCRRCRRSPVSFVSWMLKRSL